MPKMHRFRSTSEISYPLESPNFRVTVDVILGNEEEKHENLDKEKSKEAQKKTSTE
jgi:hypothetical protein